MGKKIHLTGCAMFLFATAIVAGQSEQGLYRRIASLPTSKSAIKTSGGFLYEKYPLSGTFQRRTFDSAAATMLPFLAKLGTVHPVAAAALDSCSSGQSDSCLGARYCCVPLELSSVSKEKKMSVGNFVKLDKNGDFVPSQTATTLSSSETETRLRFVIVDLAARTIVLDIGEKRTSGGDLLDAKPSAKPPTAQEKKNGAIRDNVLEIMERIKVKVRERMEKKK